MTTKKPVSFSGSGIALTPGEGWQMIDLSGGPGHCPPALVSKAGVIQVLRMLEEVADLPTGAANLRMTHESDSAMVPGSYREESVTATEGVSMLKLSSEQQSNEDGELVHTCNYNYLVRNKLGRVVTINYIATKETDSDLVHTMIRTTLRVQ